MGVKPDGNETNKNNFKKPIDSQFQWEISERFRETKLALL